MGFINLVTGTLFPFILTFKHNPTAFYICAAISIPLSVVCFITAYRDRKRFLKINEERNKGNW